MQSWSRQPIARSWLAGTSAVPARRANSSSPQLSTVRRAGLLTSRRESTALSRRDSQSRSNFNLTRCGLPPLARSDTVSLISYILLNNMSLLAFQIPPMLAHPSITRARRSEYWRCSKPSYCASSPVGGRGTLLVRGWPSREARSKRELEDALAPRRYLLRWPFGASSIGALLPSVRQ